MNKVCIITDQHFGARNDSVAFLDFYEKFYSKQFFPTLLERGITTVLILGDTFDRRKYINFNTLQRTKRMFFDKLYDFNIKVYMLAGNHDTFYKDINTVNSPELLLSEYDNITPIVDPTTITVGERQICMLPWICAESYEASMKEIKESPAEVCMGHLEVSGFQMYRGMESHEGLDPSLFKRFDMVFSGHYHHRSSKGNVTYLGTPYEITWQDYADPKGFHIFDLDTKQLEFIETKFTMFSRIEYDDKDKEPVNLRELDLKDKYVKLVVVNKTDYYKFDNFVNLLYTMGCHDIKIVEDFSEFENGGVDENINLEDTLSILSNYIDSIGTDVDKTKVKGFMKSLYVEAVNTEVV